MLYNIPIMNDDDLDRQTPSQDNRPQDTPPHQIFRCIECGTPVKQDTLVCANCRVRRKRYWFENCFGPSIFILSVIIWAITTLFKAIV